MPFVTRYSIERLTPDYRTEFYTGYEHVDGGWSEDPEETEWFRTEAKAWRRADRVGGEVTRFQRFSHIADAFSAPVIQLVAAE